jgi:hypothetical protein
VCRIELDAGALTSLANATHNTPRVTHQCLLVSARPRTLIRPPVASYDHSSCTGAHTRYHPHQSHTCPDLLSVTSHSPTHPPPTHPPTHSPTHSHTHLLGHHLGGQRVRRQLYIQRDMHVRREAEQIGADRSIVQRRVHVGRPRVRCALRWLTGDHGWRVWLRCVQRTHE